MAEQQARVQAIKEVHDRERDRLLRGQQDLQQQVYGQQVCTGLTDVGPNSPGLFPYICISPLGENLIFAM